MWKSWIMLKCASSSHEATKNLINAYWNALLRKARWKSVGRFWRGPDIAFIIFDYGVTSLSNILSILLAEKGEHSFLNIDQLINLHVSGKSGRRWKKKIPSTITTSNIFGLFKTLDFSNSFINVVLVVLLILPSIWHRLIGIGFRG